MKIEKQIEWSEFLTFEELSTTAKEDFQDIYEYPAEELYIEYAGDYYAVCSFMLRNYMYTRQHSDELEEANICALHNLNAFAALGLEISNDNSSYRVAYITT